MENNQINRPKVGLALSGSGSRLVFYIGFLEKLSESGVPVDYVSACSGGSVIAAAYACGGLKELRDYLFSLDIKTVVKELLPRGKNGLYKLDLVEEKLRDFTKGLTFEEVRPHMSFIAVDLENNEQVVMSMGDIAHAARVSCTIPGATEAVKWGGKTLIDGGLLSIIPTDVVKEAGMDIVIGVNMRGTKHMFTNRQMAVKRAINFVKKVLLISFLEKLWGELQTEDEYHDFDYTPGMLNVLSRSMDLAIEANKQDYTQKLKCDLMISPDVSKFKIKNFLNFQNFHKILSEQYELGWRTAEEYIPKILDLINNYQAEKAVKEKVLET